MKAIICTCNDEIKINARDIRLFLDSKEDISEVKIYRELCNKEKSEKLKLEIKNDSEKTIVGACSKSKNPFVSEDLSQVDVVDLKNLCASVHSENKKINSKVKRLLEERIRNLKETNPFNPSIETKKKVLSMERGFGNENNQYLLIDREHCPSIDEWSCRLCKESCPKDLFNEERLALRKKDCNVCGVCNNVCPLNLIEVKPKKDLDSSIKAILSNKENQGVLDKLIGRKTGLEEEIIVFNCERNPKRVFEYIGEENLKYPPEILPIFVSCLTHIDLENILNVFSKGGQGIVLLGCDDCFNKSSPYIQNILEKFNSTMENTVFEDRVEYLKTNGRNYEKINNELNRFISKIDEKERIKFESLNIEISKEPLENYNTTERKKTIQNIKNISKQLDIDNKKLINLFNFHIPKINKEKCNGCNQCTEACSTNAIQNKEQILVLQEWKCVGCEKCVEACSQGAIELEKNQETPLIKDQYIIPT